MTLQEIFTKVATHLLTQGKKSEIFTEDDADYPDSTCAYRGSNGTSCAVGCLIKDEHYDPGFEGRQVSTIQVRTALNLSGVPTDHETMRLLGTLQHIHDARNTQNWPIALQTLADSRNLEMPK